MNAIRGTHRLILDDMRWFLKLFTLITVLLVLAYVAVGLIFNVKFPAAAFGPMYGGICGFAVSAMVAIFPVAIGLGSTRTQFMKSFYLNSIGMVIGGITVLNVIYVLMHLLHASGLLGVTLYQPGQLYASAYEWYSYYWIDLMVGFLILGLSAFLTVSWIRLGFRNFFIVFFTIALGLTLFITLSDLSGLIRWITETNGVLLFTLLGTISGILLLSTYPMMKHAPLVPKGSKG